LIKSEAPLDLEKMPSNAATESAPGMLLRGKEMHLELEREDLIG
jgi:hypothetical protein